jgi:outer membrane protein assembly factor BamB
MMSKFRKTLPALIAFAVTAVLAGCALWAWSVHDAQPGMQARLPGADGTPAGEKGKSKKVDLKGRFEQFDGVAADLPGAWPRFRGADFDNVRKDGPPLADAWPKDGPPVLWKVDLGEGHAGPAVLAGRVYLVDYDETTKSDAIRCFSLADGKEIWRHSYTNNVKRNHGMSRTVPAVTEKYLVSMGPRCHVVCLDPVSGAYRWGIDLQRDYGTKEPLWYTGQCPLIEDGKVILAPCGTDVLMMAVDAETGAPLWKTPNARKWNMSHASVMPMTIADRKMYVYCAVGGIAGVSAEAADAGTLLWEVPWNAKVVAPSPVLLDDGKILLCAGYGEGSVMIQVHGENGAFTAETRYKRGPKDGITSEQQTPIVSDGLLYGIMPKDSGALRSQFVCYNFNGDLVWSSGQTNRFGLGPYLLADGKFFVLNDEGELTMIKVRRDGYTPLATAQILHGQDSWGPMALAGDRLLLRDSTQMVCISLAAGK